MLASLAANIATAAVTVTDKTPGVMSRSGVSRGATLSPGVASTSVEVSDGMFAPAVGAAKPLSMRDPDRFIPTEPVDPWKYNPPAVRQTEYARVAALPTEHDPLYGATPSYAPYPNSDGETSYVSPYGDTGPDHYLDSNWRFQLFPHGLIYRSYLAGAKESRFRGVVNYEQDDGWLWDITLGGRVPIMRYGTVGEYFPQGWQLDIEGASLLRLDLEEDHNLVSADFRFGVPLTYGVGRFQFKFAYYHLSSHLGDEYIAVNPDAVRINYSRDALVYGISYYATPELRFYGEAGWAFYSDISLPWEFQFGIDYSPNRATGLHGAPFAAINAHLREDIDFSGNLVVQVGRQWRSRPGGPVKRLGVEYYNGLSEQFEFYTQHEQKVGIGLWYDY